MREIRQSGSEGGALQTQAAFLPLQDIDRHLKILGSGFRRNDGKRKIRTFYETINFDDLVKSHQNDGFVKSSRCKARKN